MSNAALAPYTLDDFLVVLVLYRIELKDSPSYISLSKGIKQDQQIDMLVYDNSPDKNAETKHFEDNRFRIQYINDPSNPGVSTAYNAGISKAAETNKKWILFLDQDTTLDETLLDKFLNEVNTRKDISIFATTLFGPNKNLISPSRYFFKRGFALSKTPTGVCKLDRTRPINSTVLVATQVFKKAGLYNENIRLDFSDHEFFDRVNQQYEHMFVVHSNSFHSLSSSDDTNIEGIKIRFGIFCEGARIASNKRFVSGFQYFIVCGLRALKLSIKFRTSYFMNTLFKEWTKSKK
ncbi:hypothetical protein GQR58_027839 [Nymphon striatum]|nr:hypothetical protein GQR58_027839 [Nymphon striatum]